MRSARREQFVLFGTLFQVLLGFGIVIPILPYFARELGANSVQMGLLVTVWAGAQFLFSPLWGSLSDRVGRRPVLLVGLAGYAFTFGVIAFATNIWVIMVARFLGGVLSAATIPTAQAYVADTSTGEERAGRMAAMGAAMNLGFICGPAAGGVLAWFGLDYQGAFLVAMGLALLNWVVAFFTLPEPEHRRVGAAKKGFSGLKAVRIAMAGPESLLFLLAFAGTFGGSTMFSMLGYYLMDRLGGGADMTSLAFTVEGAASVIFQGLLVGWSSRRFGEARSIGWALLAGIIGMFGLVVARSLPVVLVSLCFIGLAVSFVRPLVTSMVSRKTRMEQGVTMGIQTSFDALGRTVAPLWAGAAYLWRDWAPFASAIGVYLIFYIWTRIAWGREEAAQVSAAAD